MAFERFPVRRVERDPASGADLNSWPFTLPVIRQVLTEGLDLSPLTILVGENGSGKSTLVEGVALAYGFSPEGGSTNANHSSRVSESSLHEELRLSRGIASRWGFFLRAETMHGFYTYLEENPDRSGADPRFHEMSHGESFLTILRTRFNEPGFFCLDEPESALSFTGCLALVGALHEIANTGGQALIATHSPLVAAIPGARILELGEWGIRRAQWDELEIVDHWRRFLDSPQAYLRHVIDEDPIS
jgi:predicted ATPase